MPAFTLLDENEREQAFEGELLNELQDMHQIEIRTPWNTETVQLYRLDNGEHVYYQTFQFEEMDVHHREIRRGKNPASILETIDHPTDLTVELLEDAAGLKQAV